MILKFMIMWAVHYYIIYLTWTGLEYLITGEYEVRIIDTIMSILFTTIITVLAYKILYS